MSSIHKERGLFAQDKLLVSIPEKTPEEMKHLMDRYHELVKHLKSLKELLKKQKEAMSIYHESRAQVLHHLAIMAGTSPIKPFVEGNAAGGYKTVHNALRARAARWDEKFDADIVKRVAAWETAVSERVHHSEKLCSALRRDLVHYQNKVGGLHADLAKTREQGREVTPAKQAKSDRNDEKLREASEDYKNNIRAFELYLERVIEHGWRDLVPIVHRLATWDVETSDDQARVVALLADVIKGVEQVCSDHGVDPRKDCIEALKVESSETLMSFINNDNAVDGAEISVSSIEPASKEPASKEHASVEVTSDVNDSNSNDAADDTSDDASDASKGEI